MRTAGNYLSERVRAKISVGLRQKLFAKALRSDYVALEKYHSGDLLTRLTADISEVASDTVNISPAVAGMAVQGIGAIGALLSLDPLFTLLFAAGAAAVGAVGVLLRKKLKKYHRELTEADGESRSFMQESIASALTLKAYGAEERTAEKSGAFLADYYRKRMRSNRLRTGTNGAFSLLSNLGFIFALVWCGVRILRGDSDFGTLFSTVLLLGQLQYPLTSFSAVMPIYYARAASAERLQEIDRAPEEPRSENCSADYENLLRISAEHLSFGYGRGEILSDAGMSVDKGSIVCITGGSGAGKSTLFKLLLSVYAPDKGEIRLFFHRGKDVLFPPSDQGRPQAVRLRAAGEFSVFRLRAGKSPVLFPRKGPEAPGRKDALRLKDGVCGICIRASGRSGYFLAGTGRGLVGRTAAAARRRQGAAVRTSRTAARRKQPRLSTAKRRGGFFPTSKAKRGKPVSS